MTALPPPPSARFVLSFDFDGTLHHPADDPPVPRELFRVIESLRRERGAVWGINTGRSMEHVIEGMEESGFPFLPDWVVAREREIHLPCPAGGWEEHHEWNRRCRREIDRLFLRVRGMLRRIRRHIEERTGAEWMEMDGDPAGIISRTVEEMDWIVAWLAPFAAEEPELAWQRNSIWLRFGHRDFHKGSSLTEVASMYGLGGSACFAAGDGHNDLEMLDEAHAGMAACPANAVAEVLAKVRGRGGYVARAAHGAGVVEALRHGFPALSSP
jgi:hydroxymethylpyrimidine pyrophosphatase-like HAD family hydrolase